MGSPRMLGIRRKRAREAGPAPLCSLPFRGFEPLGPSRFRTPSIQRLPSPRKSPRQSRPRPGPSLWDPGPAPPWEGTRGPLAFISLDRSGRSEAPGPALARGPHQPAPLEDGHPGARPPERTARPPVHASRSGACAPRKRRGWDHRPFCFREKLFSRKGLVLPTATFTVASCPVSVTRFKPPCGCFWALVRV